MMLFVTKDFQMILKLNSFLKPHNLREVTSNEVLFACTHYYYCVTKCYSLNLYIIYLYLCVEGLTPTDIRHSLLADRKRESILEGFLTESNEIHAQNSSAPLQSCFVDASSHGKCTMCTCRHVHVHA